MEILPLNVHLVVHSYGTQKVCEEQLMHVPNPIQCVVVERMRFRIESPPSTVSYAESSSSKNDQLDYKLTTDIRDLLDEINSLVKDFRMAGERIRSSDDKKVSLRLIGTRQRGGRQYNLPTASEVASLIVEDFDPGTKRGGGCENYGPSDVISRMFKIKLDCLMKEIKDDHTFGRVEGGYAILKEEMMGVTLRKRDRFAQCYVVPSIQGPDRVSATIDDEEVDEIKDYLNCRYLSACEAAWRIYGFDIHYRTPSVERLPFHLKDEQQIILIRQKALIMRLTSHPLMKLNLKVGWN
ncbi:hypothetical protein Tco_0587640 [Tanacetum coccineum]